jgi:hypothetical protein
LSPLDSNAISLMDLAAGMPAITPAFGTALAEAGAVCLTDCGHSAKVLLAITGDFAATFLLDWPEVTPQMRRCWNDQEAATEHGAYGLACLLILRLTDFTIIERSRRGTGFDYWVGYDNSNDNTLFSNKARLEVSGIRIGSDTLVKTRLRQKVKQIRRSSHSSLPAFVIVVEFGRPTSQIVKRL